MHFDWFFHRRWKIIYSTSFFWRCKSSFVHIICRIGYIMYVFASFVKKLPVHSFIYFLVLYSVLWSTGLFCFVLLFETRSFTKSGPHSLGYVDWSVSPGSLLFLPLHPGDVLLSSCFYRMLRNWTQVFMLAQKALCHWATFPELAFL